MEKRIRGLLLCWMLIAGCSHAGGLSIWPVNPHIETGESSSVLWMKNNSPSPMTVQARVLAWTQDNYRDTYEQQHRIAISPPIITIPSGAQQMFRIVNRQGITSHDDSRFVYRILIDEIPTETTGLPQRPISFQIRYSLPFFITEKHAHLAPESLHYDVEKNNPSALVISNAGDKPARISQAEIVNPHTQQRMVLTDGLLGYVLPNSRMRWTLTREQAELLDKDGTHLKYRQERRESAIHRHP